MPVNPVSSPSTRPPADMISTPQAMNQMDFLQMLTAQLKAQDPMNPLQGQEFASQLAQFSSLQQLTNMGQTMDQTLQANVLLAQTFNNTMAASLIGKTVRAEMDSLTMGNSGSANLTYSLPAAATSVKVEIKDSDGNIVRTINVNAQAAGEHGLSWDGNNSEGRRVAEGKYTYSITATGADGNPVQASTYLEGRVTAVRYVDGQAVLTVNGETVQLGQVLSISDGSDNSGDSNRMSRI